MSPVANKGEGGGKDEVDEGFHSPSISQCSEEEENMEAGGAGASNGGTSSNRIKNTPPSPPAVSNPQEASVSTSPEAPENSREPSEASGNSREPSEAEKHVAEKARSLASFIITKLTTQNIPDSKNDSIENTLLRCCRKMMEKHEILFKGMMRRLAVTRETGYVTFVGVVNELFQLDGEGKVSITWGRIVGLYAFGGQLALYCREQDMSDFTTTVAEFLGNYAAEVVTPFVHKSGGWIELTKEFPAEDEDLENKAWKLLTWTALGMGLVATATFFSSH